MILSPPMLQYFRNSALFFTSALILICCAVLISITPNVSIAAGNDGYLNQSRSWSGPQNLYVPRIGRVRVNFPADIGDATPAHANNRPYGIAVHTLVGTVAGSSERVLVSYSTRLVASLSNSGSSDSISREMISREMLFHVRNPRTGRVSYVRVTAGTGEAPKVRSVPSTLLSAAHCGSNSASLINRASASNAAALLIHSLNRSRNNSNNRFQPNSARAPAISIQAGSTLRVAFVADTPYSGKFGANTEQHLVTMLDQVNVIYRRDLGLFITPVLLAREKAAVSALGSSDSSSLLDGFAVLAGQSRYGNADVYHLLTGKDLADNIIGLANLPGACAPSKSTRVSLSQYLNPAIDYMTMAHEIGHNLSAEHDTSTLPPTIMFPSLPVDDVRFSAVSERQISTFTSFSSIQRCLNAAVSARGSVALSTKLNSSGETSLSIALPTGNDSCSVLLEASQNTDFTNSRKVTLTSMESLSLRVFSKVNSRANRRRRIFVRASTTCGQSTSTSTISVSPASLSKNLRATSPNAWASNFINSFR